MSLLGSRFLVLAFVLSGACAFSKSPLRYAQAAVGAPHAELIVRTTNHTDVAGAELTSPIVLDGAQLETQASQPRIGMRQSSARVAPGKLTVALGSVFQKIVSRWGFKHVIVYITVNGKTESHYETHLVLIQEPKVVSACRLERSIDVRAGKRYVVQYDYYWNGECRATCKTTDAQGRLTVCPGPVGTRVAKRR